MTASTNLDAIVLETLSHAGLVVVESITQVVTLGFLRGSTFLLDRLFGLSILAATFGTQHAISLLGGTGISGDSESRLAFGTEGDLAWIWSIALFDKVGVEVHIVGI